MDSNFEQRAVIKFLWKENISGKVITQRLKAVFGDDAYSKSTVYEWIKKFNCGHLEITDQQRTGRPPLEFVDREIIRALQEYLFHSIRTLAEMINVSSSTIHSHLTEHLGLKPFHLKWVPYFLTAEMKENRVRFATNMLIELQKQAKSDFKFVITGDESWFYFNYSHTHLWSHDNDNVPQRVNLGTCSSKLMLTIMWSVDEFFVVEWLENGMKFNSQYFCNIILEKLIEKICFHGWNPKIRKFLLHVDNARPHNSAMSKEYKEKKMLKRLETPAYSPDLDPSDFYLFGYIKEKLKSIERRTDLELLQDVHTILGLITREQRLAVFREWVERLKKVIESKGEYI